MDKNLLSLNFNIQREHLLQTQDLTRTIHSTQNHRRIHYRKSPSPSQHVLQLQRCTSTELNLSKTIKKSKEKNSPNNLKNRVSSIIAENNKGKEQKNIKRTQSYSTSFQILKQFQDICLEFRNIIDVLKKNFEFVLTIWNKGMSKYNSKYLSDNVSQFEKLDRTCIILDQKISSCEKSLLSSVPLNAKNGSKNHLSRKYTLEAEKRKTNLDKTYTPKKIHEEKTQTLQNAHENENNFKIDIIKCSQAQSDAPKFGRIQQARQKSVDSLLNRSSGNEKVKVNKQFEQISLTLQTLKNLVSTNQA